MSQKKLKLFTRHESYQSCEQSYVYYGIAKIMPADL